MVKKRVFFTKNEIVNLSLLLFLFAFIVNCNSISNLFAFDDHGLILENKYSIEGTDLQEIFTHNYRYGAGKNLGRSLQAISKSYICLEYKW